MQPLISVLTGWGALVGRQFIACDVTYTGQMFTADNHEFWPKHFAIKRKAVTCVVLLKRTLLHTSTNIPYPVVAGMCWRA
jgi:hypothetical protein